MSAALATTVVGTTPASLTVSNSGSAVYVVPLQVPPGVAGLKPTLSLKYDSQAGRDIAGPGWVLDGLPSIRRCAKSKAQDGERGGITLTSSDRFCYQGMRLVMPAGQSSSYGADSTSYRTEIDTFARVTSYGTGPDYFYVEEKGGLRLYFGQGENSKVVPTKSKSTDSAQTNALVWYLSKITDRNGNSIDFSYKAVGAPLNTGEVLLDAITYAGGNAKIEFKYKDDPNPRISYVAGYNIGHTKLLDKIVTSTFNGGTDPATSWTVRKGYSLGYDAFDAKGVTESDKPIARLSSVTECNVEDAAASTAVCLPPLKFSWNYWSTTSGSFSAAKTIGSGVDNELNFTKTNGFSKEGIPNIRRFADINGDGRPDLIAFWNDKIYAYYSKNATEFEGAPVVVGQGFGAAAGFSNNFAATPEEDPRYLVDLNRDGYPDILGFVTSTDLQQKAYVSYWNKQAGKFDSPILVRSSPIGTGSCYKSANTDTDAVSARFLADMNADGYPDVLRLTPAGAVVSYFDPNGGDLGNPAYPDGILVGAALKKDSGCANLNPTIRNWIPREQPVFLVDMNGDGYPDFVAIDGSSTYVTLWDPVAKKFADTLTQVSSEINCCADSSYYAWPTYLVDMNADGYPDLVQLKDDGVYVALWNGKSFQPRSRWTTALSGGVWSSQSDQNPRQLIDMDGDGYPDLVAFSSSGVQVALSTGSGFATPKIWESSTFKTGAVAGKTNAFGASQDTPRFLIDITGDGTPEVVGFGDHTLQWSMIDKAPGQLLTSFANGLGETKKVEYAVAQPFSGIYTSPSNPSTFPVRDITGPYYVVKVVSTDDGVGGFARRTYTYGVHTANFDRGPLGFNWIASHDEQNDVTTKQYFTQAYPNIGYQWRTVTSVGGIDISDVSEIYANESLGVAGEYSSNTRYFNYVSDRSEIRKDLKGLNLWTKSTNFNYAVGSSETQWGDLKSSSVSFSDGSSSTKSYSYFAVDEAAWLLGRLKDTTETVVRPAQSIAVAPPSDAPPATPASPPKLSPSDVSALMAIIGILLDD